MHACNANDDLVWLAIVLLQAEALDVKLLGIG